MFLKLLKYRSLPVIRKMSSHQQSSRVKVQVKQGVVVGQQDCTKGGVPFHSYLGVPYAVPPVGELRFKSPLPLERFEVLELDCSQERDVSHQRDPFSQQIIGTENCLFLNIYAPQTSKRVSLPVMVWIHGGGFMFGSGSRDSYLPEKLIEEEVIVVTLNYRLGALGFLCIPDAGIWGNAGLKDQRLALEWVQDNIAQFNGNPANVTIFGESAGAASVHLHCYAKHAKKSFHKAIMQSGTANAEWVFQSNPTFKAIRLAEELGCTSTDSQEIFNFLQSKKVTPLAMLAKTLVILTPDERRRGLPIPFKPVIEDSSSPDSFVTAPVLEMLRQPNRLQLPTIIGYNSAEGLAMLVNAARRIPEIEADIVRFVPRNFPYAPDDAVMHELAKQMRDFYLGGKKLSPELFDNFTDLLSDYHFTYDMQQAAELQARHQPNAPLYFFRFDYVGKRNMFKRIFQFDKLRGACHGDEMFYLFQTAGDDTPWHEADALLAKRLCNLWANFARHSEPTPDTVDREIIDFKWHPVIRPTNEDEAFNLDFLAIDKICSMQRNPDAARMKFWRKIYQQHQATDYSRLSAKL